MKNNNLIKVRNKLDKLDIKILSLIKKRTLLVNQVIKTQYTKEETNE